MQIGVMAKKIGLTVDAIRFYERSGLLPRARRTQGGFRRYGEGDVKALSFIRRAQGLGFTLAEIHGMLALRNGRLRPCGSVRNQLQGKLADVHRKLADLRNLEYELRAALRSCDRELRKRHPHCPVLREPDWKGSRDEE